MPRRVAMTLIELLVVIAIIAMVVALLLPAVQAVRETVRIAQCRNHARQLAMGCVTHLDAQGFWPSGGWGSQWTGEADLGFGKTQPGGWGYHVLPFIEQTALHQLGAGITDRNQRRSAASQRAMAPVAPFYCPSRRAPAAYPASEPRINANRPSLYAKTDFALNLGDTQVNLACHSVGPSEPCLTNYPACFDPANPRTPGATADNWLGTPCDLRNFNGISTLRSEMPASVAVDGMSVTLLLGEKSLNPDHYFTGTSGADNGDAWAGRDQDNVRWTAAAPVPDTPGVDLNERFGGPHATGFVAAACDGAVRLVTYTVDPGLWRRLGNCRDTMTGTGITDWPDR